MNIEVFIEELRGLFFPKGKLNVASTNNIPGQPMPRFDMIQFVEAAPKDINTYIRNLQDRIKAMIDGSAPRPYRESPNGRCNRPDLFFRLTRPNYPDGRVTKYSEDDTFRFIEKIEIGWETVTVHFKAGISVELKRGE